MACSIEMLRRQDAPLVIIKTNGIHRCPLHSTVNKNQRYPCSLNHPHHMGIVRIGKIQSPIHIIRYGEIRHVHHLL